MPSTLGHATTRTRESLRDKSDKREEVSRSPTRLLRHQWIARERGRDVMLEDWLLWRRRAQGSQLATKEVQQFDGRATSDS